MVLAEKQIKIFSSFCNDVSKALMIGVVLGQGYIPSESGVNKIYVNIFWFSLSILLLISAIIINRQNDKSK